MCKVFFVEMKSVFLKGTFKRGAGEPKNEKREVERGWRAQKEIFLLGLFPFKNKQDFVTVVKVCLVAEHKDYDWFFLPRQQHYCSNWLENDWATKTTNKFALPSHSAAIPSIWAPRRRRISWKKKPSPIFCSGLFLPHTWNEIRESRRGERDIPLEWKRQWNNFPLFLLERQSVFPIGSYWEFYFFRPPPLP